MLVRWLTLLFWFGIVGSATAETRNKPTRVGAEVIVPTCGVSAPACDSWIFARLSPEVALGIVAFNSPYLFGSLALRDALTCRSCHAESGPSGPAERLVFDAPVPLLYGRRWGGPQGRMGSDPNLEVFARHAIVEEFDGPEPARDIVAGLAAYVRQLPSPHSSNAVCLGAKDVVLVALSLVTEALDRNDRARVDFLLESARFTLGEDVQDALIASRVPDPAVIAANVDLKGISALASAGRNEECERAVRDLSLKLQNAGRPGEPWPMFSSLNPCPNLRIFP
jgi:hypothetical protein